MTPEKVIITTVDFLKLVFASSTICLSSIIGVVSMFGARRQHMNVR